MATMDVIFENVHSSFSRVLDLYFYFSEPGQIWSRKIDFASNPLRMKLFNSFYVMVTENDWLSAIGSHDPLSQFHIALSELYSPTSPREMGYAEFKCLSDILSDSLSVQATNPHPTRTSIATSYITISKTDFTQLHPLLTPSLGGGSSVACP